MMYRQIRLGDTVWSLEKGNGIIDGLEYYEKVVFVNHYNNGRAEYSFDDLLGSFDERLNQWVISPL